MSDSEHSRDFVRALLAWFIPPVGVFLQVGIGLAFWLNLVLTLCGWLPGVIHAAWVISTRGPSGRQVGGGKTFFGLLLSGLIPPLAVFVKKGLGLDLLINVVLLFVLWFPAVLHAVWVSVDPD